MENSLESKDLNHLHIFFLPLLNVIEKDDVME